MIPSGLPIHERTSLDQFAPVEDALNEGQQLLQSILQSGLDGFYLVDTRGRFLQVNDAYCAISGYSRQELLHMHVADVEASESAEDVAAHIEHIIRHGKDRFESRHRRKDGQILDIETSVNFQNFDGGRFFCFLRDVTEQKRSDQALRESEERYRRLFASNPHPMWVFDVETHAFLEVNEAAVAHYGFSRQEFLGMTLEDIRSPEDVPALHKILSVTPSGYSFNRCARHRKKDGTSIYVEVADYRFLQNGRLVSLILANDITERKQEEEKRRALEQQLLQAQKMEAVGRLAGGVAHDFNNLLMVIQSYTELLQDGLPADGDLREDTEQVLKATRRAASLTGQMLAFSRKQIINPVRLDLNAVIGETAAMLKRLIGEDIEIRLLLAASWSVEADSDQIVQVLMNLCLNSRDAMPDGGTVSIATENITVAPAGIAACPHIAPGEYLKLSVADTGTGIGKQAQQQIFEPFFTTKEVGKGTGLGLAMVYGIAKQNGGYVWVESEPGHGACFSLCLPRAAGAIASAAAAQAEAQPRGTETLLVAEDELALRVVVCGYLRSLGYTVLEAASGQQALAAASQHAGPIDLLITDVVMPKMSGSDVSQTLASQRPTMKTIYMSGYTDDAVLRHGIHKLGATFLQKPFSLGALARKVRDTLQNQPGT